MVRVEGTGGMPGVDLLKGMSDLLADWAPDEKVRNRILVENAAGLYGFPKGA
jgi:predicted TIM-barrel fold metal-dependent hydrolase